MNDTKQRPLVQGFTIDGLSSKDLDDAIWLSRDGQGWIAEISIADVASAITQGLELDMRAQALGSTRYLAQGNNPMLPHELSEDKLSLWYDQERMTITVAIPLSAELEAGTPEIRLTRLISTAKLDYGAVDGMISGKWKGELSPMITDCNILAAGLLERRRKAGALAVYDLTAGLRTTEEGMIVPIATDKRHLANIIVQEFMILANQTVARWCVERDIPLLFRNHKAKLIASDRFRLQEDIESVLLRPDQFSADTLSQRLQLTLNRATYGPGLEGHYALNLPAYIHFTSPIRRYADLVNHRMLRAALLGEPAPYTLEELAALGLHLTGIDHEIKDRRSASFKDLQRSKTRTYTARGTFGQLDGNEFYKVIKLAAETGKMHDELKEEILKRLDSEGLLPRDAYILLLEANQADAAWLDIKTRTFDWLAKHPEHATALFFLAQQLNKIQKAPVFSLQKSGPDHCVTFAGTGVVEWLGSEIISDRCTSAVKKGTEQLICVSLIQKILTKAGVDIAWRPVEVIPSEPLPEKPEPVAAAVTNYVAALQEWLAVRHMALPDYRQFSNGPAHQPTITCICRLRVPGQHAIEGEGKGPNGKIAKQLAAQKVFDIITQK